MDAITNAVAQAVLGFVTHHWLLSAIAALIVLGICYRAILWLFGVVNYALVQVAQALANAGVKLVPDIVAGGRLGGGGTLVDVLLASVIRDRDGVNGAAGPGRSLEKI